MYLPPSIDMVNDGLQDIVDTPSEETQPTPHL